MATTAEKLAEARDVYHQLALGARRVEMQVGDQRTVYSQASIDQLRRYIRELEDQAAIEAGRRAQPRRRGVVFTGG